jgi:hypothetical protein
MLSGHEVAPERARALAGFGVGLRAQASRVAMRADGITQLCAGVPGLAVRDVLCHGHGVKHRSEVRAGQQHDGPGLRPRRSLDLTALGTRRTGRSAIGTR